MPLTRSALLQVVTIEAGCDRHVRVLLSGMVDLPKSVGLPAELAQLGYVFGIGLQAGTGCSPAAVAEPHPHGEFTGRRSCRGY
jgi:hypothetical protein